MPTAVTLDSLGSSILRATKTALGKRYAALKSYAKAESEKLAITLRMIVEGVASGEISRAEARILLNQQRVASGAVLTAAEGMSVVAAQAALNAGLNAVKDLVNARIGFSLL